MRIVVVPYDPDWPARFEIIRSELIDALATVPIEAIEHVGSTSVPGLAAKPVIDVDVVVAADQVRPAVAALEAIGYSSLGDLGIRDRHAMRAPDTGPRRNVYVTVSGCVQLRNHLGVRDALRSDAALRDRYGDLKLELARREYVDIDGYVADKSPLLDVILERAGLSPEERADIAAQNRRAG